MSKPKVSHGRGGAANIGADKNVYTDGEIVRQGHEGNQGDGPFSTGRGGAANIGAINSPRLIPADHEYVPETAVRFEKERSHHVGRGGAGNKSHVHEKKSDHHHHHHHSNHHEQGVKVDEGLAEKLKHKVEELTKSKDK